MRRAGGQEVLAGAGSRMWHGPSVRAGTSGGSEVLEVTGPNWGEVTGGGVGHRVES